MLRNGLVLFAALFAASAGFSGTEFVVPADFRGEHPPLRATRDIVYPCDLPEKSGLAFDFRADDLSEFSNFSFYFWFGGEHWCSVPFYPTVEGRWVRMTVPRPARSEYDWHQVKGFRISGWRGGTNSSFLAVKNISVVTNASPRSCSTDQRVACAEALRRLCATPPKAGERRFVWAHNPTGMRERNWDESVRIVATNGFTDLIANLVHGPVCAYRSSVLQMSMSASKGRDCLEECLAACRKHGIRLHVWNVCWGTRWGLSADMRQSYAEKQRFQRTFDGKERSGWLCPSCPENRQLIVGAMVELADRGVDGVHFDYIRYPDPDTCFCERCHRLFEKAVGRKLSNWPSCVRTDLDMAKRWRDFRCAAITAPVRQVAEAVRSKNLPCEVSAAVFRDPLSDPDYVGQDWAGWCRRGYLDFVCPMTYEDDVGWFRRKLDKHAREVCGSVPRYPGIGLSLWPRDGLDIERLASQIRYVRESGLGGFCIFDLNWRFEQQMPRLRGCW